MLRFALSIHQAQTQMHISLIRATAHTEWNTLLLRMVRHGNTEQMSLREKSEGLQKSVELFGNTSVYGPILTID